MTIRDQADTNLERFRVSNYPGRWLFMGRTLKGNHLVQAYGTQGRSDDSRNRQFVKRGTSVHTVPADPTKVIVTENTALLFYKAMAEQNGLHVVSNGDQTESVLLGDSLGHSLSEIMRHREFEPDPNCTPRITGVVSTRSTKKGPLAEISLLRKSPFSMACERPHYPYEELPAGFGYCIHTYEQDGGTPVPKGARLPSYQGEPFLLPLLGSDPEEILEELWGYLNEENRVSIAVKLIDPDGNSESTIVIKNQYEALPA